MVLGPAHSGKSSPPCPGRALRRAAQKMVSKKLPQSERGASQMEARPVQKSSPNTNFEACAPGCAN